MDLFKSEFQDMKAKESSKYNGITIGDYTCIGRDSNGRRLLLKCNKCRMILRSTSRTFLAEQYHHTICSRYIVMHKLGDRTCRFYSIWSNMRNRTTNPNSDHYKYYGAKGIDSEAFKYFIDFYEHMYESFLEKSNEIGEENVSLERIDNTKGYSIENCIWIDKKLQCKNKTSFIKFRAKNKIDNSIIESTNLKDFCENNNLRYKYVYAMLYQNYEPKDKIWKIKRCND